MQPEIWIPLATAAGGWLLRHAGFMGHLLPGLAGILSKPAAPAAPAPVAPASGSAGPKALAASELKVLVEDAARAGARAALDAVMADLKKGVVAA